MKEYYGYIRVSTTKQGERGSSLHEQRLGIEAYATRHGITIARWFEEQETAATRGRRLFNDMLRLLDKGNAAGVVIHKIDRSARNLKDWADLGELIDRGVDVRFAHDGLDLNSTSGRFAADVQAAVAAHYVRNLREEVRKGFVGRLRQGFYPLPAPIGYLDQGRAKPKIADPDRAPLVRKAFELYASGGYSLYTLGDTLYNLGLRNRRGGRVSPDGLSTMLNNQFYIGLIQIKRTGDAYQGLHEPLIAKSLFDRTKAILAGKVRNSGFRHEALFRRYLRCAHCNRLLAAEFQKGNVYYRCHTRNCTTKCLREDRIVAQVRALLGLVSVWPSELSRIACEYEAAHEWRGDLQSQAMETERLALGQISDRLIRITDAFLDGSLDKDSFQERKAALLHERAERQEVLLDLERAPITAKARAEKLFELLKALSDKAILRRPVESRDLLRKASSNLVVAGKTVVVTWSIPFGMLSNDQKTVAVDRNGAPLELKRRKLYSPRRLKALARRLWRLTQPEEPLAKSAPMRKAA